MCNNVSENWQTKVIIKIGKQKLLYITQIYFHGQKFTDVVLILYTNSLQARNANNSRICYAISFKLCLSLYSHLACDASTVLTSCLYRSPFPYRSSRRPLDFSTDSATYIARFLKNRRVIADTYISYLYLRLVAQRANVNKSLTQQF